MSFNFSDVYPKVSRLSLDPNYTSLSLTGKPSGLQGPAEGDVWYDSVGKGIFVFVNGQVQQLYTAVGESNPTNAQTPITATNPSSAANLFTYTFPAGALNILNQNIDLYASGYYTTASGQTPTINLNVTLSDGTNTRTVLAWTTAATTASASNMPYNFDGTIFTYATGSSGTVLAHGTLNLTLGTSAGASLTSYNDTNHAASAALNLTLPITLTVTVLMSSSNAGNSVTEDILWLSSN